MTNIKQKKIQWKTEAHEGKSLMVFIQTFHRVANRIQLARKRILKKEIASLADTAILWLS